MESAKHPDAAERHAVARHQRVRLQQSALALAVYIVFAAIQHYQVRAGLIDAWHAMVLSTLNVIGAASFVVVIATSVNLRCASDPALTFAQCLFAIASNVATYAITGPARGAVLTVVVLILVFAIFALPMRRIVTLVSVSLTGLSTVMLWRASVDPARYPWAVEVSHLAIALLILPAVGLLAARLSSMRQRLTDQRTALAQALERNRHLACTDELTGLVNRRRAMELLVAEVDRFARTRRSFSVALIDIDHFKRINDSAGHAAGDEVLKTFAQCGEFSIRGVDVLARWGGEEFLLLMPETSAGQAEQAVQRLRQRIAEANFSFAHPHSSVTFSAGVASAEPCVSIDAVIERADAAMYAAKRSGRDRTVVAQQAVHA